MDKREMIESALRGSLPDAFYWNWSTLSNALAEQAIVIECEVEHDKDEHRPLTSIIYRDEVGDSQVLDLSGTHGNPGKAIAIIMSLAEDFDEFIMRETEAAIEGGIIDENTGLPFELGKK